MPHITLEHSANIAEHFDVQTLVDAVHAAALDHGLAARDALRTRAVSRHAYRIADGDPAFAFLAITARIGPGRSDDDKTSFMTALIDSAEHALAGGVGDLAIAFSAEVQELDATFRINRNHVRERIQERENYE